MNPGLLLYASFGFPLLLTALALVPLVRTLLFRILPAAPVPALLAALVLPAGSSASLPEALLGAGLVLDEAGRVILGIAALVWLLAGAYAQRALGDEGRDRFAGFWLATLTGNLLVFVAADVVSFYLAFSILSLAAFGLVIHEHSAEAHRAGRIYLVLAILGEVCLLAAFMIGADAADSVNIAAVREALAQSPRRDLALALLVAGFGIKAGLVPLHFWLPLAHPAAPVPASAVLSGAIVKAGIFGLIRFLPLDAALPGWSPILVTLGLLTTYLGIVFGLPQQRPKTVLAYSTLSQMGIVVAILGSALASIGSGAPAIVAATFYAAHHGLAKATLFLSVGALGAASRKLRTATLCVVAVVSLGIAGLPLTGGALAKLGIKDALGKGTAAPLVTLSAVGTTLLMLRFLQLVSGAGAPTKAPFRPGLLAPSLACAAATLLLPWFLVPEPAGQALAEAIRPTSIWSGAWPILVGAALLALARLFVPNWRLGVPEGDIAAPAEQAFASAARTLRPFSRNAPPRLPQVPRAVQLGLLRMERRLNNWGVAAPVLLLLGLAFFLLPLLGV